MALILLFICTHMYILELQCSYFCSSWSLIYSPVISCLMGIVAFLSSWRYDLIASSSNCFIVYAACYESGILLRPSVLRFRVWNSNYCSLLAGLEMPCSSWPYSPEIKNTCLNFSYVEVAAKEPFLLFLISSVLLYMTAGCSPAMHFVICAAKRRMDILLNIHSN